jgi:hypothetical protein
MGNFSRIRLIPDLILFLLEQKGEQGLLKLQAIHQVKDPEKNTNPRVTSKIIETRENSNSKIQQNFIIFSISAKKLR